MSYQTKAIITVLLLIFFPPIGLIFMWVWMKTWPIWLKVLLTVLGALFVILPLLAALALIAINPAQQFAKANDAKRMSDITFISNALLEYKVDTGEFPKGISQTPGYISTNNVDLCNALYPKYLPSLPEDPQVNQGEPLTNCNAPYNTGYLVSVDNQGVVTVSAPNAEVRKPLSVSK